MLLLVSCGSKAQEKKVEKFPVEKTNQEWQQILTQDQYYILRQAGTERPHSSCLLYTSPSPRDQRGSRMPSSA